jgi:flagellar protein FliO/FliZ|tara:strand:- start:1374 stop:2141 length:768 start_codon:yes stop_codon:yes gene_type:complete
MNDCWMDMDMPKRSQEGIEAPQVRRRPLQRWWSALLATTLAFGVGAEQATASEAADATIMEAVPADVSQASSDADTATTVELSQVATVSDTDQIPESDQIADTEQASLAGEEPLLWTENDVAGQEMSMMPLIAKVCMGLGLVVALAWGSVWLLRRTTLGQGAVGVGSVVRVMERTWLGPKKAIFLVDIAGRTLALGVTDEQISVLSSWEEGQIDVAQPTPATTGTFAIQLKSLLKRGHGANDGVEGEAMTVGANS